MRKLIRTAVASLAVLSLVLAACGDDDDDDDAGTDATSAGAETTAAADTETTAAGGTETTAAADTETTAAGAEGGAGGATTVTIQNFSFGDPIEVSVGDTVTFENADSAPHTATADEGGFDTGNIAPGESADVTFDEAGEFTYHCNIHSSMTGTVTVA
jgi:plastocyanin